MAENNDSKGREDAGGEETTGSTILAPDDAGASAQAELATAREEAAQFKDRWIRERADLENLKKRAARERRDALRYGGEPVLRDLLPVVDDLERALGAARACEGGEQVADGVALVLKGLLDVLERHGVRRVPAVGEPFDPARHEAVAHLEHEELEAGRVIEEHRGGYLLYDRLLRPAMVTVSKGRPDPDLANAPERD